MRRGMQPRQATDMARVSHWLHMMDTMPSHFSVSQSTCCVPVPHTCLDKQWCLVLEQVLLEVEVGQLAGFGGDLLHGPVEVLGMLVEGVPKGPP